MITKKEAEKSHLITVWWNFGKKTTDFEGTIKEYFKQKSIKVSQITHPKYKEIKGYRFKMSVGITYEKYGTDYHSCAITAIKLFLTYLGDKARIHTIGRTIDVNH